MSRKYTLPMKPLLTTCAVASRGRGKNNAQRFECRADQCTNTLTSVDKDNYLLTIKNQDMKNTESPVLRQCEPFRAKYRPNPTKEDLRDYFAPRIAVRKLVPKEAFRLQGLNDCEIELIQCYPFKTYDEKGRWEATATKKERNRMKRQLIAKTSQFKLAGNSIDVKTLTHILRTMFIPNQPENKTQKKLIQHSIFEML